MRNGVAIEVKHLTKTYKGAITPAVDNLSFSVNDGEIWGLLGPNGAGKTTTISILCGLIRKTSGEVLINGMTHERHSGEIKQLISIVPQDIALYPGLTAFENLHYIGNMYGLKGKPLRDRIFDCLQVFGLDTVADKRVETFSGGMKRRINLIAGILHHPNLVFLDEPTVGVDVQSRTMIVEYLQQLNRENTTIIYTSHHMEEAHRLCSHIAVIDYGKIIAAGTPDELIGNHQSSSLEDVFLKLTGRKLRD